MIDKILAHRKSISLFLGSVLFACGLWGVYAWRAMQNGPRTGLASIADLGQGSTPLRATRPVNETGQKASPEQSGNELAPIDPVVAEAGASSVRANAAPGTVAATEISIKTAAPLKPREAAAAVPIGRLEEGKAALARGEFIEGRRLLSNALNVGLPTADQDFVRTELTRLSEALLFSRATNVGDPLTNAHAIELGETLHGLAGRQKVTEELLASINKVAEANHLRVGQRIKLINGPFRAVIEKSRHRMDVYLGDIYVRSLPVGLGADGYTPTGEWVVNNKLRNPDWRDPITNRHYLADDPDNPIGERWIGLSGISGNAVGKTGFGIHGTIDLTSIGDDKSMGCVRLKPDDVNLVYDLLVLNDSHVIIKN